MAAPPSPLPVTPAARPRAACLCGELCLCPCHCGDPVYHPLPCCGEGSGIHWLYCIDRMLTQETM